MDYLNKIPKESGYRDMAEDAVDHTTILPLGMVEGVLIWIFYGVSTGSFLSALIKNDLFETVGMADHINIRRLHDFVIYFYNHSPYGCYGSKEIFDSWKACGGLTGLAKKEKT